MNSSKLNELDAWQAARLMAKRELRAVDLLHACLDRIAERDDEVHAFAHLDRAHALVQAHALDNGPVRGPLHGLPIGVKDLFDTIDFPTSYGSPVYGGHRPKADAASVALCREAGALVMGKTVTTEFAYFYPGATRNHARWLFERLRSRSCRQHVAAGARHSDGRLGHPARRVLRRSRLQAEFGAHSPRWNQKPVGDARYARRIWTQRT
jgi:Asp-tRNA(Asn)/Glu-tRNA(Gln) amidotransferase A subunit family amidase